MLSAIFLAFFRPVTFYGKAHGIDIRNYGSGNAGTTNMMRTLGTKAGLITFFGDCVKCMLAVGLVCLIFGKSHSDMLPLLKMYAAAGTILGHNFPFYLQFHGGKGIAATAGLVLSFDPIMAVLGIITFFGIFLTTHYVSLGSLLVYAGIMIEVLVLGQTGHFAMSPAASLRTVCSDGCPDSDGLLETQRKYYPSSPRRRAQNVSFQQ